MIQHAIRIALSAIQIIATFSRLQGSLANELTELFGILDVVNFNVSILGFECGGVLEHYWGLWKLKIFAPLLILTFFLLVLPVSVGIDKIWIKNLQTFCSVVKECFSAITYVYFQTFNIFYTLIISTLLEPFLCSAQVDVDIHNVAKSFCYMLFRKLEVLHSSLCAAFGIHLWNHYACSCTGVVLLASKRY